jgi:hypothetical protein
MHSITQMVALGYQPSAARPVTSTGSVQAPGRAERLSPRLESPPSPKA